MKSYIRCSAIILALTLLLTCVGITSASAEDVYVQPEKFIYGDVNMDGDVTIKDATLIQKGLAEISYVTAVQRYIADPDGKGFSIRNATEIQKYLANYEVSALLGTELEMATADEFSGKFTIDDWYIGECISINPVASMEFSHEYTLEDFPEYNFSKITSWGSEKKGYMYYNLYLSEPGKENLIEAVKALDYRANIDLNFVEPDVYYISW